MKQWGSSLFCSSESMILLPRENKFLKENPLPIFVKQKFSKILPGKKGDNEEDPYFGLRKS
jgi:hypothetical protein